MQPNSPDKSVSFGRYRLLRRLATGGMGEIYLAEMDATAGIRKRVVIKRILPRLARDPRFVERFLDEGRLVAQLSHSNLVPIFDVGVISGQYYLAMEYVEGVELDTLLRWVDARGDTLPADASLRITDMVARGLDYVHTRKDDSGDSLGIVHRDISPQNIMVTRAGEIKILDFGIARATTRMHESMPGFLAGKVAFLAPEQLRGEPATTRSDIYALGAVAFQMLTGRHPRESLDEPDQLKIGVEVPTIIEVMPEAPEHLSDVIQRCLAPEADERYGSAAELREALEEARKADGLGLGETALKELAANVPGPDDEADTFDQFLQDAVAPIGGTTRPKTVRLDGGDDSDEEPSKDQGTRRGFKRWIFLATTIGLGIGLVLMFGLSQMNTEKKKTPNVVRILPESAARTAWRLSKRVLSQHILDYMRPIVSVQRPQPIPASVENLAKEVTENIPKKTKAAPAKPPAPVVEKGTTLLSTVPKNAQIRIDGKTAGTGSARLTGPIDTTMIVHVSAPGYITAKKRLIPGKVRKQTIKLRSKAKGTVMFRYHPYSAELSIDGKAVKRGDTNLIRAQLTVGKHTLVLRNAQTGDTRQVRFEIKADQITNLKEVNLDPKRQ
ncbi:MAG: hypothetical protein CMH54_03535 [Myxococcales bacterium]|nr:hypothetical protein [Myxococcales bacterium]